MNQDSSVSKVTGYVLDNWGSSTSGVKMFLFATTFVPAVGSVSTQSSVYPSFFGSTAQLRPWPPPQNPSEFLGGFSIIFFFYRVGLLAPRPTPIPEDQASVFISPRGRVATHFSRLLRPAWVTVGLFLFPGHHTGKCIPWASHI
jgi:hypothetical protein